MSVDACFSCMQAYLSFVLQTGPQEYWVTFNRSVAQERLETAALEYSAVLLESFLCLVVPFVIKMYCASVLVTAMQNHKLRDK